MDFRVLGPLEVFDGERPVDLGVRAQRAVLALLLLRAEEVVRVDDLVDQLWPDDPPPTAVKTVQAHVSRLRRAVGDDVKSRIETRGQGYILHVAEGELDVHRFTELVHTAHRSRAAGDDREAATALHDALALWRGPPLADVARNGFARTEIARLEELRLHALEERIDADLALARHAEVVAELEELVGRHPLRERLRGQLMLALYRSGRQAEALAVYQSGRRALAEELGLEPSKGLRRLEQQILEQDPRLAAPRDQQVPRATPSTAGAASQRRRLRFVLGAVVVVALVARGAVALIDDAGDGSGPAPGVAGPRVEALDPETGAPRGTIPLGSAPAQIAVGAGSVWTLDADDKTISRIDPVRRRVLRTFATASIPTDLAAGAGAVWIGNGAQRGGFAGTNYPQSVSRLDPESGVVEATIRLPTRRPKGYLQGGGYSQQHVAATPSAVWAVNPDGSISRIDPRTDRVVAVVRGVRAVSVAAGDAGVWVAYDAGAARIDMRRNRVSQRVEIPAESRTAIAVGGGSVWVADPLGGSVWRVDPDPDPLLRQVPLAVGVRGVAFGEGRLWVTNEIAGTLQSIDPRTNRPRTLKRLSAPQYVAVGEGAVWATSLGPPSREETLSEIACGPAYFRPGARPPRLIVSDLPLQGPVREYTSAMVAGIRLVLERRGFRAGRHDVGYQSCDDSTAQSGGFDIFRCFGNGRAYARAVDVVGIVGSFHSFCSIFQIPIANQAPRGPLAMISPSNTFIGLTRPYRGMRRGDLERLYPSGVRNFTRIAAADHMAPVALVKAAKELGARRVFVTWDGEDEEMEAYADNARAALPPLELAHAGSAAWNPNARRFDAFARRVAAARPDAVVLAGAAPPHTSALTGALRRALGRRVALIASDGFAGFVGSGQAGPAVHGLYVGNYGIPNSKLPPAGRLFLERLARVRGDAGPDFAAAYAAQAAEILLDAIARSDGTRASVTRELRRTRVRDGILGDVSFDANGDLAEGPVTIFRGTAKGPVVDRVITVRADEAR